MTNAEMIVSEDTRYRVGHVQTMIRSRHKVGCEAIGKTPEGATEIKTVVSEPYRHIPGSGHPKCPTCYPTRWADTR